MSDLPFLFMRVEEEGVAMLLSASVLCWDLSRAYEPRARSFQLVNGLFVGAM